VSEEQSQTPGKPYDIEALRQLAELMSQHDLSEIDLEQGGGRLRLRRGPRGVVSSVSMPFPMPGAPPLAALGPATGGAAGPPAEAPAAGQNLIAIKSEAIGTFYSRPKPDAEPYVKVGSKVTPTTVVGLIEAMKLFNEVQAGCSGTVVEACVENQQAVEYGTVLFRVDPAS
jgi:acetyl-CoA carboxylase biotin carboxyl carrier protein